jgi:hypothetical protein
LRRPRRRRRNAGVVLIGTVCLDQLILLEGNGVNVERVGTVE